MKNGNDFSPAGKTDEKASPGYRPSVLHILGGIAVAILVAAGVGIGVYFATSGNDSGEQGAVYSRDADDVLLQTSVSIAVAGNTSTIDFDAAQAICAAIEQASELPIGSCQVLGVQSTAATGAEADNGAGGGGVEVNLAFRISSDF